MLKRIYPSDLSNGEYKFLKKCLPKQRNFGRPGKYERREILNAIFYLLRTDCAWRYLPRDYPDWQSVYHYLRQWRRAGIWKRLNKKLRRVLRKKAGRHTQASAACLDSQSVKTVDTARRESIGYDAGKRIKERKRHILVDTPGLLITVTVHAADISETADGKLVLAELIEKWWRLCLIRLDGGYMAGLFEWVKSIKRGRECWRV